MLTVNDAEIVRDSTSLVYPTISELLKFTRSRISISENVGDLQKSVITDKSMGRVNQKIPAFKAQPKKSYST